MNGKIAEQRLSESTARKRCLGGWGYLTEVSNEVCLLGIRCPFAIDDIVITVDVETEDFSALWLVVRDKARKSRHSGNKQAAHFTELIQAAFRLLDGLDPVLGLGVSSLQGILEGTQPWIDLKDTFFWEDSMSVSRIHPDEKRKCSSHLCRQRAHLQAPHCCHW